jgi:NAD(P)-dependent dehydrogenase (short-subunit alcohol dehydrogenase family)
MTKPLEGQIALVAGSTRAAGRGIARELAAAGAKVYCTGRSTRGAPATPGRPETIEETAELIQADGGEAVAIRVDHQIEAKVEALAQRVRADEGRLDVLVNDVWGGDSAIDWGAKFWALDIVTVQKLMDQAVFSHLITARHLAPMMVEAGRGLIIEVTDGAMNGYRGQLLYDLVKASVIRLAYAMAWDLVGTGVTALALSPGFLRSEAILDGFGVTEATWRDAVAAHPDFGLSETPRFIGRAVAALAGDKDIARRAGLSLSVGDLATEYGFDDIDGRRPHFWRDAETWLAPQIAAEERLPRQAAFMAESRYMSIHLTPALADQARIYADKLGWNDLGAGLAPLSTS